MKVTLEPVPQDPPPEEAVIRLTLGEARLLLEGMRGIRVYPEHLAEEPACHLLFTIRTALERALLSTRVA